MLYLFATKASEINSLCGAFSLIIKVYSYTNYYHTNNDNPIFNSRCDLCFVGSCGCGGFSEVEIIMKLKYLVIHCTATPAGMRVSPMDIKFWHTAPIPQGRGWKQVGYSDMIIADGTVMNLVPYNQDDNVDKWEITNGVAGINSFSRHVVYVGGAGSNFKGKDTRTPQQMEALKQYVINTIALHPDILIAGHNQFAKKDCPSFNVPAWCHVIGVPDKNIYNHVTV